MATLGALTSDLPPMISVARAAELIGVSRSRMYDAVKNGDWDGCTLQVNGRTWILTARLLDRLGLGVTADA